MFSEALTVSLFHFLFCSLFADKERNRKETFSVSYQPDSVSLRFGNVCKSKTILNSRWYWYLVLVIHLDHLCFDNALCDVHLVTKVKEIHRVKEYTYQLSSLSFCDVGEG